MIDAPGPWGTGPFTLVEGYSSISTPSCAIQRVRPEFVARTWLIAAEDRSDRVVLEANRDHWNAAPHAALERVVFRNDLAPSRGARRRLRPATARSTSSPRSRRPTPQRCEASEHARLVTIDANRVLVGVFNRHPATWTLDDRRHARGAQPRGRPPPLIAEEASAATPSRSPPLTPDVVRRLPRRASSPAAAIADRARALLGEARLARRAGRSDRGRRVARGHRADRSPTTSDALGIGRRDDRRARRAGCSPGPGRWSRRSSPPPWDILLNAWFDLYLGRAARRRAPGVLRPRRRLPRRPGDPRLRRALGRDDRPVDGPAVARARRADRPLLLRAGHGAVPVRAAGALRGQPARRASRPTGRRSSWRTPRSTAEHWSRRDD